MTPYQRGSAMTLVVLITSQSLSRPTGWGRSPTKYSTPVLSQGLFVQRLGEKISRLIMSTYGTYAYYPLLNVVAKVVESDVQEFRPRLFLCIFAISNAPLLSSNTWQCTLACGECMGKPLRCISFSSFMIGIASRRA